MSIMLNGTKYNGAYMNGKKINGYLNGKKLFSYQPGVKTVSISAIFTLFNKRFGYSLNPIRVPLKSLHSSYSLNDLEKLGLNITNNHWIGSNFNGFITSSIKQNKYPVIKGESVKSFAPPISDYEISVNLR